MSLTPGRGYMTYAGHGYYLGKDGGGNLIFSNYDGTQAYSIDPSFPPTKEFVYDILKGDLVASLRRQYALEGGRRKASRRTRKRSSRSVKSHKKRSS